MAHRMNDRLSVFGLLLVAVALATVIGHVCALPGHVHATPHDVNHAHSVPVADGHVPTPDADAASCEALRGPSTTVVLTVLVVAAPSATSATVVRHAIGREPGKPVPTSSPPLYLAHRTLLI